jgi:hypothetical protein
VEIHLPLEIGWILDRQSQLARNQSWFGVEPELGLAPRLQVAIGGPAFVGLAGFGGVEWIRTETSVQAALRASAEVGIGFSL